MRLGLVLILLLVMACKAPWPLGDYSKDWLRVQTSVQQAESDNMVLIPELGATPISFGLMHEVWLEFKALIQPGDELWTYEGDAQKGYCIVRAQKVIYRFAVVIIA